jgi:3,4-dihydroxy 2-butanone 4-phosphate synthase/GTP cyclohydrolase II
MSNKQVEMSPIEDVVAAIARGEMIVMVDDEDRENEGDLIMAAQFATAEKIAFIVRHTSGVVVAPLSGERCDDLRLPLMVDNNTESHRTAFTIRPCRNAAWTCRPKHFTLRIRASRAHLSVACA